MTDKPIAYALNPVYEPKEAAIMTAAVMTCMATGRILSGMGGGGEHLAPEIVDALRANGRGKVILDSNLFDAMKDVVERMASTGDVRAVAVMNDERMTETAL